VVTIEDGIAFEPQMNRVLEPNSLLGGVEPGPADRYVLELDSPTALRTLNALLAEGTIAELALESFPAPDGGTYPAGSVVFAADPARMTALASAGRETGVWFRRLVDASLPALEPIEGVPRIAVLTGSVNQDIWSLRDLGFPADRSSSRTRGSSPAWSRRTPVAWARAASSTGRTPVERTASSSARTRRRTR
jgi:hypothetical protein